MPKAKLNTIDARIGARLRTLRLTRGVSQADLGRIFGVTWQQVQKYEKGTNRIAASKLFRVAQEYDVSIEYFAPNTHTKSFPKPSGVTLDEDAEKALQFAQSRDGFALMRAFVRLDESTGKALIAFAERLAKAQADAGASREPSATA